jgi:transposase-like protein
MVDFKGSHFETEIILVCVRWYLAYPLSYRQIEEIMQERGVSVDHSTLNRWVLKYTPLPTRHGEPKARSRSPR